LGLNLQEKQAVVAEVSAQVAQARLKPVLLVRIQLLFIVVYFLTASQHQFGLEQKAMEM
jgi:hypothetical protein